MMNSSQIARNHLFAMLREYFERDDCSGIFLNKKSHGLLTPLSLTKGNSPSSDRSIIKDIKNNLNHLKISIQTIISIIKISNIAYDSKWHENPATGAQYKTLYEYISCYIKHSQCSSSLRLDLRRRSSLPCLRHITHGILFWRRAEHSFFNKGRPLALVI